MSRRIFKGSTENLFVLGMHSDDFPDFKGSVNMLEAIIDYA